MRGGKINIIARESFQITYCFGIIYKYWKFGKKNNSVPLKLFYKKYFKIAVAILTITGWLFLSRPQIFKNYSSNIINNLKYFNAVVLAEQSDTVDKISRENITAKFEKSSLTGNYQMQGAAFKKTVKNDPEEKTEIKIGNENADYFEPSFEFSKWDEVGFKLTPQMNAAGQEEKDFDMADNKIKYKTPKEEIHFYDMPKSDSLPEGGYEIERILNEKPDSNVVSFNIETNNLEYFYQPIYTDVEIADKANEGDFINLDAMGSYAIYYKNVPINYTGGKKYRTGKVGNLHRPRIDDSAGNSTYGELNIDVVTKKLTVTIPQDFLDNAVYPIFHASGLVMGYETGGTAGSTSIENVVVCSLYTMGTNAGKVDSIDVYSNPSATTRTFATGIYLHSTLAFITNSNSGTQTPSAAGLAWRTVSYSTKPSLSGGTEYLLCEWGSNGTGTHVFWFDAGVSNQGHTDSNTFSTTWANPLVLTAHSTNKYSIHANYTPVPDAPTNVAATDGAYTDKVTVTWTKSSGATGYRVYRDSSDISGLLGDVATYDDTGAAAPTITAGSAVATDGTSSTQVGLSLSGTAANNGTTHTYYVVAVNAAGNSVNSATDTGYRGVGSLTYQWQRSSTDSDGSYSDIVGATASIYSDIDAPAPTITPGTASASDGSDFDKVILSISDASANNGAGRYYKCVLNATGASQQTSTSDRGYRSVGSLTYQWQRSAGNSNADYSNIDGATTASYNDTGAPADGSTRYFKCVLNATGATQQTSAYDTGYRKVHIYSVSVDPTSVNYGEMVMNATKASATITATVDNSITKLNIVGTDATYTEGGKCGDGVCTWMLSGSLGQDQYIHAFTKNTGLATNGTLGSDPATEWVALDKTGKVLAASVDAYGSQTYKLDMRTPSSSGTETDLGSQYSTDVTIVAMAP